MMLVSLNGADSAVDANVGGKAASLARLYKIPLLKDHAPVSFALTTEFFRSWIEELAQISEYVECQDDDTSSERLDMLCSKLKEKCKTIRLNESQEQALKELSTKIDQQFKHGLAAVRSSAIGEDGADHSFAGIFETKLGVRASELENAVRECFASKFDARVLCYKSLQKYSGEVGFAVVVMEMVDSAVAGVAFSANPLNSDRDECVIDSSWGLGESVVDGSVTADRFIYDKVQKVLVSQTIGHKPLEKRLDVASGQVQSLNMVKDRCDACSLPSQSLEKLVELVCLAEKEYGHPIDVEWAITEDKNLVLLQARPITTLFWLDENMMTDAGERRILYYDHNIASEATTTTPFHRMDMSLYNKFSSAVMGLPEDYDMIKNDPRMPMFNASTRQYSNLSIYFKVLTPKYFSKESLVIDPYLSSLFASKDCSRKKYRAKKLPKEVSLCNAFWIIRHMPTLKLWRIARKFKKGPEKAKLRYMKIVEEDLTKLKALEERGCSDKGLIYYLNELLKCIKPSLMEEMGLIMFVLLKLYQKLDNKRLFGKTEEERIEYCALCGGYEGDPLMDINIAMYRLANKLDEAIWRQYDHEKLPALLDRIQSNIYGSMSDLPADFLSEWSRFMDCHGYDGEDQLFVSSPRYRDSPELLLARLRQNVGSAIKDPSIRLQENVSTRREVMKRQEERAASKCLRIGYSEVKKRNEILDHLMWIRNAPKLRASRVYGALRFAILKAETELIRDKRLEAKGDIFHLELSEVDAALKDKSMDLITLVAPRKAIHERALRANECPMLIDSRCRILRPDPPNNENLKPGEILGVAVAPGCATGKVRLVYSPTDRFEHGEVLCTTVTSPAWTPLFIGAAAIILQIGGALQHGALCAREFGKPAVSNIDVNTLLKTGMLVTVDGNKGTVTIIEEE